MSNTDIPKKRVDVDEIASTSPRIDVAKFKEWRRKMDRLERLGLIPDERRGPPPPRRMQSIPIGPR